MPVIHGDCLEVMKRMDGCCVDAIVTDPPAGISFMGKDWDHDKGGRDYWIAWMTEVAIECLRVIKPGGHALVWSIPRTSHWTATAWENAGWEVRDKVVHIFGTGFPKSTDISKQLDKAAGVEREVVGVNPLASKQTGQKGTVALSGDRQPNLYITAPASDAAKEWDGWGTALKPAHEDWILLRKPVEGTIAQNVLKHGCGGINIDGCRVETVENLTGGAYAKTGTPRDDGWGMQRGGAGEFIQPTGRFPANLIHDDSDEVRELFPNTQASKGKYVRKTGSDQFLGVMGDGRTNEPDGLCDSGSAARFFYCAKASRSERGIGNKHCTVKPLALMRHLCRLITPPGGIVLDPFAGSGSTGVAAKQEGFQSILIELEQESCNTANARMRNTK